MTALSIVNVTPVTLSTSIDAHGQLQLSHGTIALQDHDDAIYVRIKPSSEGAPVVARIEIQDPTAELKLEATHRNDAGASITWERVPSSNRCFHAWSETDREYAVVVSAEAEADPPPKPKTVYIRVRPEPDLPDPT